MQENEFEKRVHEMMKEFKMPPSDTVWEKVKRQIPKQKRRRTWIMFISLLSVLMVAGYFIYNNYKGDSTENIALKNQDKKTKDTLSNIKKNKEPDIPIITQQNDNVKKIAQEKNANTINQNSAEDFVSSITKDEQKLNKQIDKNDLNTPLKNKIDVERNEIINKVDAEKNIINDTSNRNAIVIDATNEEQADTLKKQVLKDSVQTARAADSKKKQTSKSNANKKWQFGITVFYGRSDVFENLLGIKLNSAPLYNADPTSVSGFPRTASTYSKDIKPKGAFSVGVAVKRYISSKGNLTVGLQYFKFQTEIETGAMKDSAVVFRYNNLTAAPAIGLNNYYEPRTGYLRKNSYSFIQIPIIYERSITKNKLLNWNAGASISGLISSNAVVYDNYNQAYYNNNDLFRKVQITFLGGINTQFKLGSTAVHLGPQFQYGLTNLFKHDDYGTQHLFSMGLQANIFLKK